MSNIGQAKIIWVLALGGFIPFAVLAIATAADTNLIAGVRSLDAFLIWSLVILSFLGGIRWGMALQESPVNLAVVSASVVPCIIGWFSLALPEAGALVVLLVLYAFHGYWDVRSLGGSTLSWFAPIRATLTVLVCAAHGLVLFSLY